MNEGSAIKIQQKFEVIYCYKCSVPFAVPGYIRQRWLDSGESFYCPNGHSQCYSESTVQKLEKQLANERKLKQWAKQEAARNREQFEMTEKRRVAQKAATTRLKNRIKAGMCPCCNRHFSKLQDHMATKHPEYCAEKTDGKNDRDN